MGLNVQDALTAEHAVLGAMLADPGICRELFGELTPEHFAYEKNRQIFQEARRLYLSGVTPGAVLIREKLYNPGSPEYDGCGQYLAALMEQTVTTAGWKEYAALCREKSALVKLRDLSEQLRTAASTGTLETCRGLYAEMDALFRSGQRAESWTMEEMLTEFLDAQEAPPPAYVSYGFDELDRGTYTELGDVAVIGGYPSGGKTAFALSLAHGMGAAYKVGFFSLETRKEKLRDRMITYACEVDFHALKHRNLSEGDWRRVVERRLDFSRRDVRFLQAAGMDAQRIGELSQAYGFQIVFVDYVQLIRPTAGRTRAEQMAEVSVTLHQFAQSTGTLVFELAQLSRQERGAWREPDMHDLKESGQFEQDADLIFLLYRPGPKSGLDPETHRILKIAKNKEGRRGKFSLTFDGAKQRFAMDSGQILRDLTAKGKTAQLKNHVQAMPGQQELTEIEDPGDLPF